MVESGDELSREIGDSEKWSAGARLEAQSRLSYPTKAEAKPESDVIDWNGSNDPENPLNTSEYGKWTILFVLGSATLCVTCASSMVASTYPGMQKDFHVSRETATLSLTL